MDIVIPVSAKRTAFTLGLIVAVLVAMSIAGSVLSFVPITDPLVSKVRDTFVRLVWLDGEANIPTWYSASLLLLCSALLAIIACAHRQRHEGYDLRWIILALVFLLLSLDETAQLHELSIAPLRERFHTTGLLYYGWIIPAGICVAVLGLSYLSFLIRLPRKTGILFAVAGAIYLGGAIGLEAISGRQSSLHGEHNLGYHAIITLEELFEMTGTVVFVYALLDYISRQFTTLQFRVSVGRAHQR